MDEERVQQVRDHLADRGHLMILVMPGERGLGLEGVSRLTGHGEQQAVQAGNYLKELLPPGLQVEVFCSPRDPVAYQAAGITAERLNIHYRAILGHNNISRGVRPQVIEEWIDYPHRRPQTVTIGVASLEVLPHCEEARPGHMMVYLVSAQHRIVNSFRVPG